MTVSGKIGNVGISLSAVSSKACADDICLSSSGNQMPNTGVLGHLQLRLQGGSLQVRWESHWNQLCTWCELLDSRRWLTIYVEDISLYRSQALVFCFLKCFCFDLAPVVSKILL